MLVERIAASARQQAASFDEGNSAIEQMDSLASEADLLADLVKHFSLDQERSRDTSVAPLERAFQSG